MNSKEFLEKYNIGSDLKYHDSLDLGGTGITSLPDNLTVGGYLDLRGTGITSTNNINKSSLNLYSWRDSKYILVDGIFSEVISKRGNVYKTQRIGKDEIEYVVTDGNGRYAHGDSIKSAKDDLIYKISNRNTDSYEGLDANHEFKFSDAIECYRVITGACSNGVRNFIESNHIPKSKYTIKEMIEITKGAYGHESFISFFAKK